MLNTAGVTPTDILKVWLIGFYRLSVSPPQQMKAVQKQMLACKSSYPTQVLASGVEFGRYRLESELGRGGMGVVYKAMDTRLQRYVALKAILASGGLQPQQIERFIQEARAVARLEHPNIIKVYDVSEETPNLLYNGVY